MQSVRVGAQRFSLKADLLWGVSFFSYYVFIFTACCALPLPVQGLPECQQHLSGPFTLRASRGPGTVSRLAPVGHLQQCPGGSVNVRKHLQMFLFWLQLVVRTQAHWRLVKLGTCFSHSSSYTFPHLLVRVFILAMWEMGFQLPHREPGVPVAGHLPGHPAAAGGDALNPNPCICSALRSPKGAEAWGQHVPYVRCQGPCSPRAGECCFALAQTLHRVFLDLWARWSSFFLSWHLKRRKTAASCF